MFPEPAELLLIGCLIESIWTPRSKSNTLAPRTNSQTCWQREIPHVMNGIIFCGCSTSAISFPSIVLKRCRKEQKKMQVKNESQQNQSRWWVWSHDTAWGIRTCLPRRHRQARGQPTSESQNVPLSSLNVQQTRTGIPVLGASSSNNKWSSQKWKSGEMLGARTVWSVDDKFVIDDDMDSDTATESNLSLRSRSCVNRVNDRLRKILDRSSKDAMQDIDKRSLIWWMFMSSTLEASVFMGKNYSDNLHSIKNTGEDLILKQMFDISEKLIVEHSDGILGVSHISWENWVSRSQRLMYSQILCYVMEMWIRTQHQILFWKNSWVGSKIHHNTELWTQLTENRWNSSVIFSQDSPHWSSSTKSESSWTKWAIQHNSKDELSSCRCSMTSYGEWKTMNRNVSVFANIFPAGRWSFLGPRSEKKWYSTYNERPRGEWDRVAELMMIKFRESGHPVFRATSPLSRGTQKSKGGAKLSMHFCADWDTTETVFRTIISVNQLSIYGAVSDVCEEYGICQTRTGRPVLAGQSDPLSEQKKLLIMTPRPSIEFLAQENLLQKYKEPVERFPQQDRVIKICTDAGFLKTVEVGQYLMTRSTLASSHNLQNQWHVVSTLCHEMKNQLTRKVVFEGTPKLDPCWKSQPVTCKVNMEWKLELNL